MVKNPPAMWGSVPGLGRSPGEGNGYPLQYSGLENSMDRGASWTIVLGVAKSQTGLSDFHFHWPLYTAKKDNFSYFTELFMRVK